MKKFLFILSAAICSISCNDKGTEKATSVGSADSSKMTATTVNPDYPYTLDHSYQDWQPGDKQLAVSAMKALKAYETGDIPASVGYFGDSIDVRFDNFRAKVSNDSLKRMFAQTRGDMTSIKISMGDWESVISSDKKDQWVTMWYKEVWTDKKGKMDSLSVVDDCKMENGKIAVLDEKIQHYPAKK